MKNNFFTLLYAVLLGLVCATSLTAVDQFTAERKQANARAEKMRNILGVLGVSFALEASSEELVKIYDENVKVEKLGEMETYTYQATPESPIIQAVPFAGPGLWGPIKGFLSLEMPKETIVGITFYQQEETPGLGGDIVTPSFRQRFVGKTIRDIKGNPEFLIQRGGSELPNGIDAITGATMTCDKVQAMLNIAIELYTQERDKNGR